jgi:uncharacterized protein (DUF2249 family)
MRIKTRTTLRPLLLLLSICAACIGPGARAENEASLSIDEMVDQADEVVVGEVVSNVARWRGKKIFTTSTLRVDDSLKGDAGSEVEIEQVGGTAMHPVLGSEIRMEASGFASLKTGESVVLFVKRDTQNRRHLVAGAQGKFVIDRKEAGDEIIDVAPKRLQVINSEGRALLLEGQPMTLDALKQRVEGRLELRRGNPRVDGAEPVTPESASDE